MYTRRCRSNPLIGAVCLTLACTNVSPSDTQPTPHAALSPGIRPLRYELELDIDPRHERFSGVARIRIELAKATRWIPIHGEGLSVRTVTVSAGGAAIRPATWEDSTEPGFAEIHLAEEVGPGTADLAIVYDAAFGEDGRGLYRIHARGDAYAFTHFEPLSARRAFPSFDEPRFKTPFDVTLIVSAGDVAATNTPPAEQSDLGGGRRRIRFAPTQPLPTYLIAWAVGPLDITPVTPLPVHGSRSQSLPLRGIAVPGGRDALSAALARTRPLLEDIEDYLRAPYPFEKLDIVAVPDFGPGAMENAGLILIRDELLAFDPPDVVEFKRPGFDYVMAHELAHQWFGDLVTMSWWDDIWLNEALATWLGRRTESRVLPRSGADEAFRTAVDRAMIQDAFADARSIGQEIANPRDVYDAFDTFRSDKGAGLLAMFEHWAGSEEFRDGLQRYIETHRLATATAADLLAALSSASDRDVATPFRSFISRAGVPLIEATRACDDSGGGIRVRQSRYVPLGSPLSRNVRWQVPVCIRHGSDGRIGETCELLTESSARIPVGDACPDWYMPNAEGVGYYRFVLGDDDRRNLRDAGWAHLSEGERRSVADDLEAGFRAGAIGAAAVFSGLHRLAADPNPNVSRVPMALLELADEYLVPSGERAAVERFSAALYAQHLDRIGWDAKPDEPSAIRSMRRELVRFLALRARDPGVRREAERRGRIFAGLAVRARDTSALAPELVESCLSVVVQEGGAIEFDALVVLFRESEDAGRRRELLRALASTHESALAERARALSLDPGLHPAEVWTPLYRQTQYAETRAGAWEYVEAHFDALVERAGRARSGWMPWLAAGFCSSQRAAEVEAFLAPRVDRIDGGARHLLRSLDSIHQCAALAAEQGPATAGFFRARP